MPLFIEHGDKIKVDTRTGEYMTAGLTACDRPDERSDARERALYLLYEAHSKGIAPSATIELQVIEPDELTQQLVEGVGRRSRRTRRADRRARQRAGR